MACRVIAFGDGGGKAIVRRSFPKAKRCGCGAIAIYECDWKVEKFVPMAASELFVGDGVRLYGDESRPSKVIYADLRDGEMYLGIDRAYFGVLTMKVLATRTFYVLRSATCDAPCCERCAREVDEEVHYCARHRDAWKSIA